MDVPAKYVHSLYATTLISEQIQDERSGANMENCALVTKRLQASAGLITTLRIRLKMKQSTVENLRASHNQLSSELRTTKELLENATNARFSDMQRFKAALDSYRANQRLSTSYEADLEEKVRQLDEDGKSLRASRNKLQHKFDGLRYDYEISRHDLARLEAASSIECHLCLKSQKTTSTYTLEAAVLRLPPPGPPTIGRDNTTFSEATSPHDELDNLNSSIPSAFNEALEAYGEGQEASFTYEAFLLEKHEEDRAEMEKLRQSNETLVADFADLLASYKDVVDELSAKARNTTTFLALDGLPKHASVT
ncbi:hypothetical protein EUX98_g7591 [Antrodiella citrinella]|uniref:Uncharacterized protein n=1 Tax=Antrodiella citrinella TaxID=2447956 RepID=A0A4S4MMU2_9APHY|nr:hypothetical protein EUX98_g7591 [Antrodiella citrinella]